MKLLVYIAFACLFGACRTRDVHTPNVVCETVSVTIESTGFSPGGFEVWKRHNPPETPDEVYDCYSFRVVEPQAYSGRSLDLYLPQRIEDTARAIDTSEQISVFLDKFELERLLKGDTRNVGLRPSKAVQDAVESVLRDRLKKRANQALLPTSTVVTPAADAPVAPIAAAADL